MTIYLYGPLLYMGAWEDTTVTPPVLLNRDLTIAGKPEVSCLH